MFKGQPKAYFTVSQSLLRLAVISILALNNALALNAAPSLAISNSVGDFRIIKEQSSGSRFTKIYDNKLHRNRVIKDTVIVRFKKHTSQADIESYLLSRNMEKLDELTPNTYLCETKEHQARQAMSLIAGFQTRQLNELNNTSSNSDSIVELIDFNEYKKVDAFDLHSNPFGDKQWHLENDGINGLVPNADINVLGAWKHSKGEGVRVAVIDTGFDTGHPDINYLNEGFDALGATTNSSATAPVDSGENHGTAVAGIIAAKDDQQGIVGVAPEAKVIPIRLIDDSGRVSLAQIIKAFKKADELGAKIINNSWGSFDPNLNAGEVLEITEMEKELYRDIASNGNNGKGILLIFASGNSGRTDFANSPEARLPFTMAVGATDSTDQKTSYSVSGPELDIVAPGGGSRTIITTDRRDLKVKSKKRKKRKKKNAGKRQVLGYSQGNITNMFRGTSAAAPVVAGVAALVWSLNPNFKAETVRSILNESAYQNPSYNFVNGKNNQMGHGRVNAAAAVELAFQRR